MSNRNHYLFHIAQKSRIILLSGLLFFFAFFYATHVSAGYIWCGGICDSCRSYEYTKECPAGGIPELTESNYDWSGRHELTCNISACQPACPSGQYYSDGACVTTCPLGKRPDASDKECIAEVNPDTEKTCNPISLDSGNKELVENDFYNPNGLSFSRYFNYIFKSQVYRLNYYDQWSMDFHQKLQIKNYASNTSNKNFTNVVLQDKALKRYNFYINNTTGVITTNDPLTTVVLTVSTNATDGPSVYTFTYADGTQYRFNANGDITSITNANGIQVNITNTFDTSGVLTKKVVTNSYNQSLTFNYTSQYNFTMADPDGHLYRYVFDSPTDTFPKLTVILPDTTTIKYTHQTKKTQLCNFGICNTTNSLDGDGALLSISYNDTIYLSYTYDSYGRAQHSHKGSANAEKLDIVYDVSVANTTKTSVTNASNQTAVLTFNQHANKHRTLTHIKNEASVNCVATDSYYSYDTNGFRKTFTDRNGNVTETLRNSRGLVETERNGLMWSGGVGSTLVETAASQKIVTVWHATLALPLTRTYYGLNGSTYEAYKQEATTYTTQNRMTTFTVTDLSNITDPYGTNGRTRVWTYGYTYYDANNIQLQQQTIDGPRTDVSDVTTYNYDAQGNVSSIVNAAGHATSFAGYNSRGLVGSITDVNGMATGMTYTVRGWLDTITYNDTAITDYDYYANGLLQKITLPDGSWLQYFYNDARHLLRVENNLGEKIEYTPSILDGKWTQETVNDASSTIVRQRQRIFDELGRVMSLQGQNDQSWEYRYDQNDNLKTENDALQQLTSYEYDTQNRISETLDAEQNAKAPAERNAIAYGYDIQGNLSSVTDQRGNTTSYLYDGFGRLIKQTSPDTGTTIFFYDAAANLTGKTDARGLSTSYQYDTLNRLTATLHLGSPAEDVSYSYDATENGNKGIGRLTGYADSNGTTSRIYDAWGLGDSVCCLTVMQCFVTSYVHNTAGQLTSLVYPSGNSVIYGYDTLGRVNVVSYQEVGEPLKIVASNISYQPFGGMKNITFSNGVVLEMANDNDGRITGITATDANGTLYGKTYGHTVTDNIQSITDVLNNQNSRSYTYDKLSRLTVANKGVTNPITTSYAYDEVGNRTDKTVVSGSDTVLDETLTYPAGSNRLQSVTEAVGSTSKTYNYDATGNITAVQGANLTFTYNHGNRMNVSNALTDTTGYVYNALGQRVVKIPNGDFAEAIYYHFGSTGQLLAEHHLESSIPLTENIYVNGILLAQMDDHDGDLDDDGWSDSQEQACGTDKYNSASTPIDAIADIDGDSQCNAFDNDDDNDVVSDVTDNCPSNSNTLQQDQDNDGIGDACDGDIDSDTVANTTDNCPTAVNADQLDTDADLMGDACDIDDDNDGNLDAADNCPLVANPDQLDTDADLIGDLCDADMDNDGLINLAENCPNVSNLDQLNTDGDLMGNVCDGDDDNDGDLDTADNCPLLSNANQADQDGDGLGNVCDPDRDGDGILNAVDNCPASVNTSQADLDGDGLGNVCDTDRDGDGINNGTDNCASVANVDQWNTDGDLYGNACDTDDDNDRDLDTADNCPLLSNANQADQDGDGLGNVCDPDRDGDGILNAVDNCPASVNTSQADLDGDGLGNVCDTDRDGDGINNGTDNCASVANVDQWNTDDDLYGNACDADDDNDDKKDTVDNCPLVSNMDQLNTDADLMGDACDAFPNDPTKI